MIKYEKTIWENDKTPVNAQHLGKVEDGLEYLFYVVKDVPAGEDARIANEKQRQVNETTRQNNELKRNDTLNVKVKEVDNAIAASNNNIEEVKNKFETIVASKQQDAEVILARGKYPSLPTRLDNLDKDLLNIKDTAIIPITTESDFVTVEETTNGYLTNFKLEGKTLIVNSKNEEVKPGTEGAILKSVGDDIEEIVVSSLKTDGNLCIQDFEFNGVNSVNGSDWSDSNYGRTKYFILPKGRYKINVNKNMRSNLYKYKNGVYINYVNVTNDSIIDVQETFTVRADFTQGSNMTQGFLDTLEFIVYKEGAKIPSVNSYESDKKKVLYYDTETQTWKKPTLKEWDSVEEHSNGKYYYHKRSFKETLKGSSDENWSMLESGTNQILFFLQLEDLAINKNNTDSTIICDKLNSVSSDYHWNNNGNLITVGFDTNQVRLKVAGIDSVEGIKQWLQSNNVTIVYQLAQEEVCECIPIDLMTFEGETNYMIECGAVTPKSSFKYEGNIGNVINTLKEKVSNLEDKLYNTNLANFTVALNALDTKLKLEQLTKTPTK